jgi:FkbM family methyltransferase
MVAQSKNRIAEALRIVTTNPLNAARFCVDQVTRRRGKAYCLSFRGINLFVRPLTPDLRVVRTCLLGEFDEVLSRVGIRHGLIIDAGGYIGLTSIIFARQFPGSKVVCIEPSSDNYRLATKNCSPYANIEVLHRALAARPGAIPIYDRGTGPWGYTAVGSSAGQPGTHPFETVDAITIDEILERHGSSGVDLVKIDIEGAEYDLLKDRPSWVPKADVIVVELHDRICPGASRVFAVATEGRQAIMLDGEKHMSVAATAPVVAAAHSG